MSLISRIKLLPWANCQKYGSWASESQRTLSAGNQINRIAQKKSNFPDKKSENRAQIL